MGQQAELKGPDLERGIASSELVEDQPLLGHAKGEGVVLVRHGSSIFAVGASCTHYGGPLAEGIVQGETIRCPWHHACFHLRSGEAIAAPALTALPCYRVEEKDGRVRVIAKSSGRATMRSRRDHHPASVVIIGGGAAGLAAADMLRRESYTNPITILSTDESLPCDRPNLSKDYLAGTAPEEWIPVKPAEWYPEQRIDLRLSTRVQAIDPRNRRVITNDGRVYEYEALLLATGADPIVPDLPGARLPHVHVLRTLAHSRAIIEKSKTSKRAVCVGASFIGLEVAASLRARGIEVDVVSLEAHPLERVMGAEVGSFVQKLHESRGVRFHLNSTVTAIDEKRVTLADGRTIDADLVVLGVGVRPNLDLAKAAGLKVDRGVIVDEFLRTSDPNIWAAGDIARWPDPRTQSSIRVEHWVVAQRHGQVVARNMIGDKTPCRFVPFFWSVHYDTTINYVGHVEHFDRVEIDGSLDARDCTITYFENNRALAYATIGRDHQSLERELALEQV